MADISVHADNFKLSVISTNKLGTNRLYNTDIDNMQIIGLVSAKFFKHLFPALFEYWRLGVDSKRGRNKVVSFMAAIRFIWRERNMSCFEGKSSDYHFNGESEAFSGDLGLPSASFQLSRVSGDHYSP